MADSTLQFQAALVDFAGFLSVLKQGAAKWVVRCSVLTEPAHFQLVLTVSDAEAHIWELKLGAAELQKHQTDLGLEQVDWNMYFRLLKGALVEKRVTVREAGPDLSFELEYPLAQAKLRGSFSLKRLPTDHRGLTTFLLSALETALQPVEKRERPPSPELTKEVPHRPAPIHKPSPKKRKKITELGSKIT